MIHILWLGLFLSPCHHSLVQCLECNSITQYKWPSAGPSICCDKCQPGHMMKKRCHDGIPKTQCKACEPNKYAESRNIDLQCKPCASCSMENQVKLEDCTPTQNAVCGCKPGYKCKNEECSACEKIPKEVAVLPPKPNTTRPDRTSEGTHAVPETSPPSITELSTQRTTSKSPPAPDIMIPGVLCVCVCILLMVLTLSRRLMSICASSICGRWPLKVPDFSDGSVGKPVQEENSDPLMQKFQDV
ncbi:tumor necrosis factor receptor superfamily member 4-like [Denticeps clupeoides]|uniref:tumor necrosis factor receptor superfamily member 4-like n=1 Tax=Denticeps clupeoides TaxID=299321 RepID=UPI0010A31079|nr:tumor necrosis factor receptor superfamily member 4-like [Denticeps clupeoides]